mmetsp:Transcript_108559/g.317631  ORF Transcript_108559/g.317631 Transcript_108559/m.317631 type:complete len:303 (-) Transcript_108559:121-1029(-)
MVWLLASALLLALPSAAAQCAGPQCAAERAEGAGEEEAASLLQARSPGWAAKPAASAKEGWKHRHDHRRASKGFNAKTCNSLEGFSSTFTCNQTKIPMRKLYKITYELFGKHKWSKLEQVMKQNDCNGGYPPCEGGFDWRRQPLVAGQKYDRYVSSVYQYAQVGNQQVPVIPGQFVSPFNTTSGSYQSFGSRALYGTTSDYLYYVQIEVLKNLTAVGTSLRALSSTVIPWYGEPGLGVQTYFELPQIGSYALSWNALTGLLDDDTSESGSPYFKVVIVSSPEGSGECVGCQLGATASYKFVA